MSSPLPPILLFQSLTPNLHRLPCVERIDLGLCCSVKTWLLGFFPLGESAGHFLFLPTGERVGSFGSFPLGERVGGLVTPRWGRGSCSPTGQVGFMVTPFRGRWLWSCRLGSWVLWLPPLAERVGCMVTPRWGRGWVAWLLPSGERVREMVMVFPWEVGFLVLPAGGEGGLHNYSPLGERVGFMVLPAGGEGRLHVCASLGERVGEMVMIFPLGKLVS